MKQTEQAPRIPQELAQLVEQARAGSQDAYTAIYRDTSPEIYRSIHAMVRSDELSLDIQQDTYVYAFTHLDQLGEPAKLRTWLHAIALNRTRSVLRKQTPVLFSELENGDGPQLPELADLSPEASPELRLEQKETARYVREILDSLTAGQRMLVGMYYYEQLSVGQIARELEISPGTVKSQLYRGRKKIEQAVQRLEAQGVKLYGLSPLPFLLALLKREEPPAEAGRAALRGVLSKTAAGSAGEAAAVTGAGLGTGAGAAGLEAAAVHVGRSFFQTAGGRVVLALLAAAAVGGGVLGYGWARDQFNMGNVQPTTEPIQIQHSIEIPSDSDEDLILDSTEAPETVNLDSAEDLTEPTEPDTTEPATEPEITEPTTEPTSLAPPELDNPGSGSSNPDTPITVSTEPKTTEPELSGESSEAATEQPTELTITEASEAFSETTEPPAIPFGFYGAEIIDPIYHPIPVESNRIDTLKVGQLGRIMVMEYHLGEATPVYCEPSDILSVSLLDIGIMEIDPLTNQGNDLANLTRYDIRALKPGTVKIYCRCMNADMTRSSLIYIGTITVTEDSENNG